MGVQYTCHPCNISRSGRIVEGGDGLLDVSSITRFATMTDTGDPIAVQKVCWLYRPRKEKIASRQRCRRETMLSTLIPFLSTKVSSMVSRAGDNTDSEICGDIGEKRNHIERHQNFTFLQLLGHHKICKVLGVTD